MMILNNLFDQFDEKYAVQVVKHDYKTKFPIKYLGHKNDDYPKKNWSSVILFNCSHPKNKILTPKLIETAKGSYLHRFSWLEDKEVGEISKEWNYLVLEYPETKKQKFFIILLEHLVLMILIMVKKLKFGMNIFIKITNWF